jgi:hypothetical protein
MGLLIKQTQKTFADFQCVTIKQRSFQKIDIGGFGGHL